MWKKQLTKLLLKRFRTVITNWFSFIGAFASGQNKPNIVFILADDLGWKDLACYGNKNTETPDLDLLAKNGIHTLKPGKLLSLSSLKILVTQLGCLSRILNM